MKKIFLAIVLTLSLAGCASLGLVQQVATATVPAAAVVATANAFDVLKGTATNYGKYCIAQKMAPAICSASTRRAVIKFVRSGTAARNQLEGSIDKGEPAAAS